MYLAQVTLFFVLCVISEQSYIVKNNQGITDITVHPISGASTCIYVRFDSNSITYIPINYFKNLPSLDRIYFHDNAITNIADTTFVQVPTVTVIDLRINQLTVIREMMFSGLPNLWTLRLSENQIHTIELGSFRDNTALTWLLLDDNLLQSLPRCIFGFDNHPTGLDNFNINRNPLQCGQDLCWLKQVDTTWITVKEPSNTECAGPAALAGRKWDSLSEQDLCISPG